MKRKRCFKTVLSGMLAAMMLFTSAPVDVLAASVDPAALEEAAPIALAEEETIPVDEEEIDEEEIDEEVQSLEDEENGAGSDDAADGGAGGLDAQDDQTPGEGEDENTGEDDPGTEVNAVTGHKIDGNNVTFTYVGDETTTKVQVAGSMTNWEKNPIDMDAGDNHVFTKTMELTPGDYQYKFIVNGSTWIGEENDNDKNRSFSIEDPDGVTSPVINGREVTFLYKDNTGTATQVRLAGTMTDWGSGAKDLTKNPETGLWELKIELAPGNYQYKFIVGEDGWTTDPGNKNEKVDGNSAFTITGLEDAKQDVKRGGSAELPKTLKLWSDDGNSSDASVTYTLADSTYADQITLTTETVEGATATTVTVAADLPDTVTEFALTASDGTNTSTVTISVKDFTCVYTIYYYDPNSEHMTVDAAALWLWQTSGAGASNQTDFDETEVLADGNTWLKKTIELGYADVSLIPKAYGSWEWQDGTGKRFVNTEEKEAITLYTVFGDEEIYTELPKIGTYSRYLVVDYTRTSDSAADWTFYTWNGGYGNMSVPFTDDDGDGTATVQIPVKEGLDSISFVLAQTASMTASDWIKDGGDFVCPMPVDQSVVKIKMEEGKGITYTYPYNVGYEIDPVNGKISFYYRDDEAFLAGSESGCEAVTLELIAPGAEAAVKQPMVFDADEQRYEYVLNKLEVGSHYYRYGVKKAGAETYVLDAFNETSQFVGETEYSVLEYDILDIAPEASMSQASMDYNDNNVLTVKVNAKDKDGQSVDEKTARAQIKRATVDLSAVGGGLTEIEPELMAISIAVKEGTAAGVKTLPIVVYDQYENAYKAEAKVEVVPRGGGDFDWDEAVIYFAVTDRFYDGNAANNEGGAAGSYDKTTNNGSNSSYHGGDFAGLTQKLDYLQELGVNTIWITPIVENQKTANAVTDNDTVKQAWGYHGYWAKDFEKLDAHLGTEAEFGALLDAAHAKGMKVMVDVVLNHSGYGTDVTDYFNTNFKNEAGESIRMLRNTDEMVNGSDQQFSLSGLPDFRTEDPEVRELLVEWQSNWVSKYPIDYYRVDTVKHVDDTTWSAFKNALTQIDPDFKMIGEWSGAGYTSDTGMLRAGRMDSLLDFDFNDQAATFVTGNLSGAESFLSARNAAIDNTASLGSFLSSHDENGFIYSLTEKGKTLEEARNLALVAASLQMTAKGQVVIYYGEEIGDSDGQENYPYNTNRDDFDWTKVTDDNAALAHYKKMLSIRNDYTDILAKGTRTTIAADNAKGVDVFKRSYGGKELTIALNITGAPVTYTLALGSGYADVSLKDCYSGNFYNTDAAGNVEITIPAAAAGGTVVLVEAGAAADDSYSEKGYRVTFDYNCGAEVKAKVIEVEPGALITENDMAKVRAVKRKGYSLQAEWYRDAEYKKVWNFDTDTVQEDMTLYALWLKESDAQEQEKTSLVVQEIRPLTYTGSALKPSVIVYADVTDADGNTERIQLKANRDYKVTYKNNVNAYAGELKASVALDKAYVDQTTKPKNQWFAGPYVEIKGSGSYSGYVYQAFEIVQADIKEATLNYNTQLVADKQAKVVTSLKYKKALKEGTDYDVVVKDAGGKIIAETKYKDEAKTKLNKAAVIAKADAKSGTYAMTITAKGNYKGTVTGDIMIAANNQLMQKAVVSVGANAKSQKWTGKAITLTSAYALTGNNATTLDDSVVNKKEVYTVKLGGKLLKENRDFVVSYRNNVNVGTATMVLTGLKSEAEGAVFCTGTKEVTFKITGSKFAAAGKDSTIKVKDGDAETNGKDLTAAVYTGRPVTKSGVVLTSEQKGEGDAGKLVLGRDYNITYKNNLKSGNATVTFTATERSGFTGKFTMKFKIDKADLSELTRIDGVTATIDGETKTWTAAAAVPYTPAGAKLTGITPHNAVSGTALKEKTDYTISDVKGCNYKKPGEVKALLKGKGNYKGQLEVNYTIGKATIDDLTITGKAVQYNPAATKDYAPAITVKHGKTTLKANGNNAVYEVAYQNCKPDEVKAYIDYRINNGAKNPEPTATVTLKDSEYYDGLKTATVPLTIFDKDHKLTAKKVKVNFNAETHYYEGGRQIRPSFQSIQFDPKGKFAEGTENAWITLSPQDYDITWGANNKTGNGTMKITGKGIYSGTVTVKFKIEKKPINRKTN
ncbi:MAG: alpha-amylase family glycosyl hydrolase [Bacteroidales bacterium]|nr:alpha-amylase family glycosyl hydrolase [Bacteroidales bacterium]MCM1416252.1 alpha-amylase family glycosyl hydrolase [bacterium]MCM1423130.1 alpha-amylase family glycosyl hydrolase [bacterium]